MYIVNPFKPFEQRMNAMFSTHPPIAERLAALRGTMGAGANLAPRELRAPDDFSDMPEIPDPTGK